MKQNNKIIFLSVVILSSLLACGLASVYGLDPVVVYDLQLCGLVIVYYLVLYTVWNCTIQHYRVWHQGKIRLEYQQDGG